MKADKEIKFERAIDRMVKRKMKSMLIRATLKCWLFWIASVYAIISIISTFGIGLGIVVLFGIYLVSFMILYGIVWDVVQFWRIEMFVKAGFYSR